MSGVGADSIVAVGALVVVSALLYRMLWPASAPGSASGIQSPAALGAPHTMRFDANYGKGGKPRWRHGTNTEIQMGLL